MNKGQNDLKAALRALVEDAQRHSEAHLTPDELIAYHSDELSAEEEKRVQDHLVICRDCVGLLLDLEAFPQLDQPGARPISDAEVAAAWQAIQPRLPREERGGVARPSWWQRFGFTVSPVCISYAVAASLLMVSLALGGWILSLRRDNQRLTARFHEQVTRQDQVLVETTKSLEEARRRLEETTRRAEQSESQMAELRQTVDELSQPQLNTPIIDIYPRNFIRSQEGGVQTVEVPSGANLFTLILNVADGPFYPSYALEILNPRGQVVWHGAGLQESQFDNFTVTLSRQLFPAGSYRIRLYGLRAGRRQLVEDYGLRIRYQ